MSLLQRLCSPVKDLAAPIAVSLFTHTCSLLSKHSETLLVGHFMLV